MSILRVDAIRDNGSGFNDVVTFANSGGTENGKLARAFVNFNGSGSVAIRASFNVNSITDNSTGDYTVNFSNAMSDANYSVSGTVSINAVSGGSHLNPSDTGFATGSVQVFDGRAFGAVDRPYVCVSIFR